MFAPLGSCIYIHFAIKCFRFLHTEVVNRLEFRTWVFSCCGNILLAISKNSPQKVTAFLKFCSYPDFSNKHAY